MSMEYEIVVHYSETDPILGGKKLQDSFPELGETRDNILLAPMELGMKRLTIAHNHARDEFAGILRSTINELYKGDEGVFNNAWCVDQDAEAMGVVNVSGMV